jgi:uncharacterized protein (DUF1330 family)
VSAYFVAQIQIQDPAGYERYLDGFDEVFDRYDGEVLAVDDHACVLEGEWPVGRTVLMRFPDRDAFMRWYESPEYQALAAVRRGASRANVVMVRGYGADG